jgi:hypothetical protein
LSTGTLPPASTPLDLIKSCLRIIREDLTGGTDAMRASNLEVAVPVSSLVQGDRDQWAVDLPSQL